MGRRLSRRGSILLLCLVACFPLVLSTSEVLEQSVSIEAAVGASVSKEEGTENAKSGEGVKEGALSDISNSTNATDAFQAPEAAMWVWPTANDPNAENLIHSILVSWCGDTFVDAVKDSYEKAGQFEKLRRERDERYTESIRCSQEGKIREREMEMECERARQLMANAFDQEREKIQTDCDAETTQLKSELENCQVKLKKKGVGACQKDILVERAACDKDRKSRQAALVACQGEARGSSVSRVVELEELALRAPQESASWLAKRKQLSAELGECRPAQAKAKKRLLEVMTDGKVGQLESKVMWLQIISLNLLLLVGITAALVATQLFKESQGNVEGGHGWIRTMPPVRLQLVDADTARAHLVEAFEENKGSRLAIVLATDIFYGRRRNHTGPNTVFLLVPINITSARRFMLFNADGDYTAHVEKAREIVAKSVENPKLLVVLYEAGGCVFTEATLQSLRLTADKVAHEAIPADMDFPQAENLVVLWLDKQEGLRASDSTQESDAVTDNIKCQPWAQYLLMRSGRWGQVHAQFM